MKLDIPTLIAVIAAVVTAYFMLKGLGVIS